MQALVKIKRISKKRGLSLYQLNNQAGLKANVIYSWKTKNPSVEKLKAVADVLDVSVDYLLNDANEASLAADPTELSKNQRAIAKSIDPDISNDDCQAIIKIRHEIMKLRISN